MLLCPHDLQMPLTGILFKNQDQNKLCVLYLLDKSPSPFIPSYGCQLYCALILIVLLNNVLDVDLSVPYQSGTFLAPVAPPVSLPLLQLGLLLAGICTCPGSICQVFLGVCVCLVCESHLYCYDG